MFDIVIRRDGSYFCKVMYQSDVERWTTKTLRSAVSSVLRAGRCSVGHPIKSGDIAVHVERPDGSIVPYGRADVLMARRRIKVNERRRRVAGRPSEGPAPAAPWVASPGGMGAVGPAGGDGSDVPGGAKAPAGEGAGRSWLGRAVAEQTMGTWGPRARAKGREGI
jgi:hypothetical protein